MNRRHKLLFAAICISIFVCGFVCNKVFGANYNYYPFYPTNGGCDSARTVSLRMGETSVDSTSSTSFPATPTFVLNTQYWYVMRTVWFCGNDTDQFEWPVPQVDTITVVSYNHKFTWYTDEGYESVKVRWKRNGSSLVDSFTLDLTALTFPYDTTATGFDADYFYKVEYLYINGTDSVALDGIILPMVAQSGSGGSSSGGCGDGPVEVRIFALDTSGTDTVVSGVVIGLTNLSTGDRLMGPTLGNGSQTFGLEAATYRAISYKSGYVFDIDTFTVVNDEDSLAVTGYDLASTYTVTAQVATVTVNVKNASGGPAEGITISAYLKASRLADSSGAVIIPRPITDITDSLGQVTFSCIWSSYLTPATQWRFTAVIPSGTKWVDVTIPRQSTYTVDFTE